MGEQVTIELRAPGATSVEVAGDFTKWSPVTLSRSRGDRWTMSLRLVPGVYRIHVRVDDGEWAPPPGVSRMVDPYEGMVGVLVVS
jgi:1,4-alpha-glucan branching enzyme